MILDTVQKLRPLSFWALRLDVLNCQRIPLVIAENQAAVESISRACQALDQGADQGAQQIIEREAQRLLKTLRDSSPYPGWEPIARTIDQSLQGEALEIMELPQVPDWIKIKMMRLLEHLNLRTGAYATWGQKVDGALGSCQSAHVYELAAGMGGFCRYLAEHPPGDRALRLTASDWDPVFVHAAKKQYAEHDELISFELRDATQLYDLQDIDLFVCAQAAHHMSVGQIITMIHLGLRARCGIFIIDLMRSMTAALAVGSVVAMLTPLTPLFWDGVQSVRRGFLPSELQLLATLAGAEAVRAELLGPTHLLLHAAKAN